MGQCQHGSQKTFRNLAISFFCLIALVTVVSVVIGCANAFTAPATSSPTVTAKPTPKPAPSIFEEMLGLIPDTPETRAYVRIVDHTLRWEALALAPKSDDSDTRGVDLFEAGRTFLNFNQVTRSTQPNLTEYLALDPGTINQSLLAGTTPRQWEILGGRFDPKATEQALSRCTGACLPPDAREEYQGVTFYSWGEDFKGSLQDRLKPPAFDKQGRGGRIAVLDNYVYRTLWTDGIREQIDAGLGRRPSLAEVEDFRLLAENLSELGSYEIYLSDDTQSVEELDSLTVTLTGKAGAYDWLVNDEQKRQTYKVFFWDSEGRTVGVQLDSPMEEVQQLRQELQQSLLRPYLAYGTGRGLDSDGRYIGIVLAHADEDLARENVVLLQQRIRETVNLANSKPWNETVDLGRMEVGTEGRLLLAKLPLPDREFASGIPTFDTSFTLDGLLLHER